MSIADGVTQLKQDFDDVHEAGKQVEYDRFWDSFQNEAIPEIGDYRFAGAGWTNNTFKPTKSMKPTLATAMFRRNRFNGDMVALFEQQGITLDFSECTQMTYAFYECSAERLGVIDCTAATSLTGTFGYMYNCHTIDLIKVHSENTFASASTFRSAMLVEVRFEGVIAQNGVNFQWSPLSHDSLISLFDVLEDKTEDTSGTIWLVTLGSGNMAKLTQEELDIAKVKGWRVA